MKFNAIDLFSGAGGFSLGFEWAKNFNMVCANEISENIAKTYSLNNVGTKMYNCDINNLKFEDIIKDTKVSKIHVLVGGPPCQAFSTVGKRLLSDPRAQLFKEYYRLLKDINPDMFVFENVKGILSFNKGDLFREVLDLFGKIGYNIKYNILNAADYGVPQVRKRVIIVGSRIGNAFEFPLKLSNKITFGEAVGDLPLIGCNESSEEYGCLPQNDYQRFMRGNNKILTDHVSPNNNSNLVKLMSLIPEGGSPKDIPKEFRPKSGFGNSYSKLWWNKPSTTITRNFGTPSSSRCVHPKLSRALTTREGARIQSFPDSYVFFGSRSVKNLQIGNAVPPLLAVALADQLSKYMLLNIDE